MKWGNWKHLLKNLAFMFRFSWKVGKTRYFFVLVNIAVDTVSPFFYLLMPKYIIDELSTGKRWDVVLGYIVLLIVVTALLKILSWGVWYFGAQSMEKCYMANQKIYWNYQLYMDYSKLENSTVKDMGVKVANNVNAVSFIDDVVRNFFTALFRLVGYTYIVTQLHPLIILVILMIIQINSVIAKRREKLKYDFQPVVANFSRKFNYLFHTMISFDFGKDIRINKASEWLKEKYTDVSSDYIGSFSEKQDKEFHLCILDNCINAAETVMMYGYSAFMAITGKITVGSFSVYLGAITNFTATFTDFMKNLAGLKFLSKYVDDYHEYLALVKPPVRGNLALPREGDGTLEFVGVSFRYPNTEKDVLKNVSIKIRCGERLSVVGYNGAGKSTFIKLLCRFYEPTQGKILYNGTDISTIDYDQYRSLLSVVFQDYQLFAFSAKENILLDKPENSENLQQAVQKSDLNTKIGSLKEGLETVISKEFDENGIEFSGGESQKLACARAYYRDAPVVILDEPTASLDPVAESRLYERFNNILKDKTAIYISHRLASVKFCDKIAVFVDGEIKEYGTHDSLMAASGVYADMFTKQAAYYVEEVC